MKKVSILFAILAMSMAIACEKEDKTGDNGKQKPVDPNGPWAVTVNAAFANPQGRAISEQGTAITASFATTEEVYVYNGNTLLEGTLKPEADGTSTTLKGELSGEIASGDKLNLFYPKTVISYEGQDGTLAGMQNFNYAIAKDVEVRIVKSNNVTTADASFEVLQSFAKFTFNVPVKTLTISAEGLVKSIAGDTETNGDVTVTLAAPSKTVYVALRNTGAAATEYTFAVTDANDIAWAGAKSLKVASGDAGEVALELSQAERYVTVAGAGEKNGSNWANAYGTAEFKKAIGEAKDGRKFYLAAGTYVLADADSTYLHIAYADTTQNTTVSFFGGYSESGAETDDAAIFSGDDKYQIFYVTGRTTLNFKNLVFAQAQSTKDADLVKTVRGALSVNDADAEVHLEGCIFMNNKEDSFGGDITSSLEGGSAIYTKAGAVYANNCYFYANSSGSRGGVIRTEGNSRLFMNECIFDSNGISREAYGRVAFTKSNFCLNKCVFHADYATANVSSGSKNDPTLNLNFNNIITNCTLIEEAKYNGTGVIRNETVGNDGYKCMIMNNVFINTYTDGTKNKIACILLSKAGMTSSGYNLLVGQNQIIVGSGVSASSLGLKDTDENITALPKGVEFNWNANTTSYTWTGLNHAFAASATVEEAVRAVAPTKNDTALGENFANWVKSVGGSF